MGAGGSGEVGKQGEHGSRGSACREHTGQPHGNKAVSRTRCSTTREAGGTRVPCTRSQQTIAQDSQPLSRKQRGADHGSIRLYGERYAQCARTNTHLGRDRQGRPQGRRHQGRHQGHRGTCQAPARKHPTRGQGSKAVLHMLHAPPPTPPPPSSIAQETKKTPPVDMCAEATHCWRNVSSGRTGSHSGQVQHTYPAHAQPGHVGSNGLVLQLLLLVRPLPLGLLLLLERSRDRLLQRRLAFRRGRTCRGGSGCGSGRPGCGTTRCSKPKHHGNQWSMMAHQGLKRHSPLSHEVTRAVPTSMGVQPRGMLATDEQCATRACNGTTDVRACSPHVQRTRQAQQQKVVHAQELPKPKSRSPRPEEEDEATAAAGAGWAPPVADPPWGAGTEGAPKSKSGKAGGGGVGTVDVGRLEVVVAGTAAGVVAGAGAEPKELLPNRSSCPYTWPGHKVHGCTWWCD